MCFLCIRRRIELHESASEVRSYICDEGWALEAVNPTEIIDRSMITPKSPE